VQRRPAGRRRSLRAQVLVLVVSRGCFTEPGQRSGHTARRVAWRSLAAVWRPDCCVSVAPACLLSLSIFVFSRVPQSLAKPPTRILFAAARFSHGLAPYLSNYAYTSYPRV
jgi:hypothetical protein